MTVVSNDAALRQVAVGAIVLQMSTAGPETTAWLDAEVRQRGGEMVDAPPGTLWASATCATLQRGTEAVGGDKDMAAAVEGARRHRPAATVDR